MAAAESRHASDDADSTDLQASVFVSADAEVHEMPVSVIKRPLIPVVDEAKVQDFMDKIQSGVELTPIEVAWVQRPEGNYYFAFGGCHRWEAHQRLGTKTIRARLIKVPAASIGTFLGSSNPFKN